MYLIDKAYRPLVIDPDSEFLESLRRDPYATLTPPAFAQTGRDAQIKLCDRSEWYSGIFVNPKVSYPGGLSVIRCAHQHRIGTPLYLISDSEEIPFSEQSLKRLAIQRLLKKPLKYSEMVALVAPVIQALDVPGLISQAKRSEDPINQEFSANDVDFAAILAANFFSGRQSFFDLYLRLRSGKYIKILQAGDSFSGERLVNYLKKGVTHFYLRKEMQASYLNYCDHLSSALTDSTKIPATLKTSQTLNLGQEVLNFLRRNDLDDEALRHATRFVSNLQKIVKGLHYDHIPILREFTRNLHLYEHGVATALVSSLLLRPLGLESERMQRTVGIASLFHDIGLLKTAPQLEDLDPSRMSLADLHLFHDHPRAAAHLLSNLPQIDHITLQAIEQHHERRDGSGFPGKVLTTHISRVAEIIGIADEFVHLISKSIETPSIDPFVEMQTKVFDGFSFPVIEAFQKTFLPRSQVLNR
ncbi:MAG: HD domain-containing phosphohydrolase [Bdellovibrionota bacterium]